MLTRKQHDLIRFIQERLEENGISPSFEEMKEALDLKSKSGVHRLVSALEERGFIRRLPNRARALEILKLPEASVKPRAKELAAAAGAAKSNIVNLEAARKVRVAGSSPTATCWKFRCTVASQQARRSKRSKAPKSCPFLQRCWAVVSITRWKYLAIPWSKQVFSMATLR